MPVIHHETTVPASIGRTWLFFCDPVKNLPRLSPPADAVVIESADLPLNVGSKVVIAARDPLGRRVHWESRIEAFDPPHAVISGMEARFVDVQVAGPFALWQHEHEFEAIDSRTTRLVDRVTYKPPMGVLGVLLDWLFLCWKIRAMLRHRGRMLVKEFAG